MGVRTVGFPSIEDLGNRCGRLIERQFDTCFRAMLRGPAVTTTDGYLRFITNEPHPFGNLAIVSEPTNLGMARAAIEPLVSLAAPTAVIFPGATSPDVAACVAAHGFVLAESMPAMAISINQLAVTAVHDGYALQEMSSAEFDGRWCASFAAGYQIPRRVADAFGPRASIAAGIGDRARYFAITHNGDVVATSMNFLEGGIAGVYCVSTLPDHRGKGLGAFVTAEPLRRLGRDGYRTAILQSSAMGESVYRKLGFREFGRLPLYVRMPAGAAA